MPEEEHATPLPAEDKNETITGNAIPRRTMLGKIGSLAALVGLGGTAATEAACASNKPAATEHHAQQTEVENERFGPEKEYYIPGLRHFPDGRIAEVSLPNNETYYVISAGQDTQRIKWDKDQQTFTRLDNAPVFGHDPATRYRNGYAGITSVWSVDEQNPYHLNALYHAEQHAPKPGGGSDTSTFTARIGYTFSQDGGKTWVDQGPIKEGQDALEPGKRITGAGQPSGLVIEQDGVKKLRMYCIDWPGGVKVKPAPKDQIYLYEAELDATGRPGELKAYTAEGFKGDYKPGELKAVIPPPVDAEGYYAALPDVQQTAEGLRAVFESKDGFYVTKSVDGITWEPAEKIMERSSDGNWRSYPTVVTLEGEEYLAYAKKRPNEDNHHLVTRKLSHKL